MNTSAIIDELEEAAQRLGYEVRSERGNFRGGRCVVESQKLIMLNENHLPETQLVVLAHALRDAPLDTIYLKPAVRQALEDAASDGNSADTPSEEASNVSD